MSNRYKGWGGGYQPSGSAKAPPAKTAPKYGNEPTEFNGILYHSKREAEYAEELAWRERAGEVRNIRIQVGVPLCAGRRIGHPLPVVYHPSGRRAVHVLDFVFEEKKGTKGTKGTPPVHYWSTTHVEVKGYDTPVGKLKRAVVEAMLGVEIKVVK